MIKLDSTHQTIRIGELALQVSFDIDNAIGHIYDILRATPEISSDKATSAYSSIDDLRLIRAKVVETFPSELEAFFFQQTQESF